MSKETKAATGAEVKVDERRKDAREKLTSIRSRIAKRRETREAKLKAKLKAKKKVEEKK